MTIGLILSFGYLVKHPLVDFLFALKTTALIGISVGLPFPIINSFHEKSLGEEGWVSGGYFVLEPEVIDFINDDQTVWENQPLKSLVSKNKLIAFKHKGFWQPMDTLREKNLLDELWKNNQAPWKKW